MSTVKELRAQLAAAEAAERVAGEKEFAELRKAATFEWQMIPKPFGFYVGCRYDEASREAFAAWREQFPKSSPFSLSSHKPDEWHGMKYVLGYTKDGEPFLYGSGGSVILALDRAGFSGFDPIPITREQAAQFEVGIVPEELKKPW